MHLALFLLPPDAFFLSLLLLVALLYCYPLPSIDSLFAILTILTQLRTSFLDVMLLILNEPFRLPIPSSIMLHDLVVLVITFHKLLAILFAIAQ